MRRFRFTLDKLLRLRIQQERQSKRELSQALSELAAVETRIASIVSAMRVCEGDQASRGAVAAFARSLHEGYATSLAHLEHEREAKQKRVDERRSHFEVRRRERETLSRLRAHRFADWSAAMQKDEQAEMDEAARARFVSDRAQEARR